MVSKGDSRLKTGIHAGAVHAVEQCLHKPFDIQVGDLTASVFFGGFIRKMRCFFQGFFIPCMGVRREIKAFHNIIIKKGSTGIDIRRPRKTIPVHQFRAVKPRVSAEDFIGTFSGQCDLVLFFDQRTKVK